MKTNRLWLGLAFVVAPVAVALFANCTPAQRAITAADLAVAEADTNEVCALAETQPADVTLATVICSVVGLGEQGALTIVDALGTDAGVEAGAPIQATEISRKIQMKRSDVATFLARHQPKIAPNTTVVPVATQGAPASGAGSAPVGGPASASVPTVAASASVVVNAGPTSMDAAVDAAPKAAAVKKHK